MTTKLRTKAAAMAMLSLLLMLPASHAQQWVDYTDRVPGAACDDAQYWTINYPNGNTQGASLQCDTWSTRGNKDGSNMTPPFMEYWKESGNNEYALLPEAEIRHLPIEGLPKGTYQLRMLVRVYVENKLAYGQAQGVYAVANGVLSGDLAKGGCDGYEYDGCHISYGNGYHHTETLELQCEVGDDGLLEFGFNTDSNCFTSDVNWLAWKDIKLYYFNDGDDPMPSDTTQTVVTDLVAGDYCLRNVATGQYLGAGGKWGVQATLLPHATLVTLSKVNQNNFRIITPYQNPDNGLNSLGFASGDLYLETNADIWTIEPAEVEGCFTIRNSAGSYLGYNGSAAVALIQSSLLSEGQEEASWQLLTRKQLTEELLAETHQDATYFISNPRFDRNCADSRWDGSSWGHGGEDGQYGNGNYCAEVWNSNFDVYQVLDNIPNGRYKLSVQGFYRYNNVWDYNTNYYAYSAQQQGIEKLYTMLYANGGNEVEVPLQSIVSERDHIAELGLRVNQGDGYGMPFSMAEAANAFTAGLYSDNALEVDVANHKLTIGIRKQQQDGCDWTIWDNFELTLLQLGDNTDYTPDDDTLPDDIPFDLATPDNPVDCTSLIKNADFSSSNGWSGSPRISNRLVSMGHKEGKNTFDVSQTLSGLPNGWYRLQAQGFYRYGDVVWEEHDDYGWHEDNGNNVWATYTIPYAVISRQLGQERLLATLYGNNAETPLPSIFEHVHPDYTHSDDQWTDYGFVPGSTRGASEAFAADDYGVSLMVPVTNGTLQLGVRKSLGYKYDWACWDNMQLFYLGADNLTFAQDVTLSETAVSLTVNERRQLSATVVPAESSDPTLSWWSSNTGIVQVDNNGLLTAQGNTGSATVYVLALGSENEAVLKTVSVTVNASNGDPSQLIINELQVSNLDMFLDPSYNYGGWVELYNPSSQGISLRNLYVSDDATNLFKFRLNSQAGAVPPGGYGLIWFDHNEEYSANVNFKPDMDGGTIYLSDASGNLLTSYTYPKATSRTSFARFTDGMDDWGITATPTPGAANAGSKQILPLGTLLETRPAVDLTPYYPTDDDVRAMSSQSGLPVLSIVGDPKHFYNDSTGIFVTGINGVSGSGIDFPCNWNRDWDRPVYMEYFVDGERVFAQECSITRFGGWSRSWYPYNFKLKAQKQYNGDNYFEYPFFNDNKPHLKHKVLQVRNGGNDVRCRIKDAALQNIIISSGFYLDCQDYQPVVCFLNGRYIGMLNLREPSNKHFALANYGIDTDEVDQMEVTGGVDVKAGTADSFWQWYSLAGSASDESVYQQICDLVDVDNFANYMAAELYLGGDDWPGNNCKVFKGQDGKFHVVLFDIDQALRYDRGSLNRITYDNKPLMVIFRNMLNNDTFRKLFIDSYCLFGGSVMEPTRCHAIIDSISRQMNPALAIEGLSTEPTATYMKQVLTANRQQTMIEALQNWSPARLSGTSSQRLTLASNISSARLQVNGIDVPTDRFSGSLFPPVVVTATAPEGYVFRGWHDDSGTALSTSASFDITGQGDLSLVAVYEPLSSDADLVAAIAMPVKVNEVSAGNTVFVSDQWKRSDWFELYNNTDETLDLDGLFVSDDISQPLKYQIRKSPALNTIVPPGGHLVVWADNAVPSTSTSSVPSVAMSSQQLHANFKLSNTDGQLVLVASSDDFVSNNASYFSRHPEMKSFVDGLTYTMHRGDQTVGRYPDGGHDFYQMWRPTIERRNTLITADQKVGEDVSLMSLLPDGYTMELSEGWNWTSHPLYSAVSPADMPASTQRIVSRTAEAIRDAQKGMVGTLKAMEAGQLYKVLTTADALYTSNGSFCPSNMPITLLPGWNWIGYPVNGAQTLQVALADYLAEEGDMLVGQDGFATYDGSQWQGSLSTLETGKGYMLYTRQAKSLQFCAPQVSVNVSRRALLAPRSSHLAPPRLVVQNSKLKTRYPNVMGIIAELQSADGEVLEAGRFSLFAYSDGEVRGTGTWVDGRLFLTAYGQGGEALVYQAQDNTDGTVYDIRETSLFTPGVEGSLQQPFLLTLGEAPTLATGIPSPFTSHQSPTPEGAAYYSLSGILVTHRASDLPRGTYIVRYANGTHHKVQIP